MLAGKAGASVIVDVAPGDGDVFVDAVVTDIVVLLFAFLAKAIRLSHLLTTG